jgi:hypothetical protein
MYILTDLVCFTSTLESPLPDNVYNELYLKINGTSAFLQIVHIRVIVGFIGITKQGLNIAVRFVVSFSQFRLLDLNTLKGALGYAKTLFGVQMKTKCKK